MVKFILVVVRFLGQAQISHKSLFNPIGIDHAGPYCAGVAAEAYCLANICDENIRTQYFGGGDFRTQKSRCNKDSQKQNPQDHAHCGMSPYELSSAPCSGAASSSAS